MVSLLAVGVMNQGASAFSVHACVVAKNSMQHSVPMSLNALPEKVEVCGNKDCRRAGGGAKLENLVKTVLEENNLLETIKVEGCECQGECGYGPNLLLDGKIVNGVKGKDAVIKALGIEQNESA